MQTHLSGLRRLPLVGPLVGWASGKIVPSETLAWAQIQNGAAKGLWLHLNPRTGSPFIAGGGEPAVQAAVQCSASLTDGLCWCEGI
jgi:hypothetical protein